MATLRHAHSGTWFSEFGIGAGGMGRQVVLKTEKSLGVNMYVQ